MANFEVHGKMSASNNYWEYNKNWSKRIFVRVFVVVEHRDSVNILTWWLATALYTTTKFVFYLFCRPHERRNQANGIKIKYIFFFF